MSTSLPVRAGRTALGLAFAVAALAAGGAARADMVLTAAGVAEGFTLTTFATGFPSNGLGPLGIAFPTTGGVLVSDGPGNVRRFATDTDGQNAASAPVGQNYGSGRAFDMTSSGGHVYMTQRDNNDVVQLNDDGTFNQVIVGGIASPHGIVTDPLNGHLIVSSFTSNAVWDVDPVAKTKTLLFNASLDGITIAPDGKTLYGAAAPQSVGKLFGYSLVSGSVGALVFDSGLIAGSPDGSALGFGPLAGKIFANTNGGTIVEVDLATKVQTLIATGGSRGDFVTVDPSNGSLLLTQTDRILRLSNQGAFTIPEPSTAALWGLGALGLLGLARRRRPATA